MGAQTAHAHSESPYRGDLAALGVCALIWGSTWIAITFQLGQIAPAMSVGYRFLLASTLLFVYCHWRGMPLRYSFKQHLDFALL